MGWGQSYKYLFCCLLVLLISLIPDKNRDTIDTICFFLIIILGIPHGAVDHKVFLTFRNKKRISHRSFHFIYGSLILLYTGLWFVSPEISIMIFLLLSIYHFGQDFLEENKINNAKSHEIILWGAQILLFPILLNLHQIAPLLTENNIAFNLTLENWIPYIIVAGCIMHLAWLYAENKISLHKTIEIGLFIAMLIFLYSQINFIAAFTIYFLVFHSENSFRLQYKWLKKNKKKYNYGLYIRDLAIFSIPIFILMLVAWMFVLPNDWISIISALLIFISILTLPHTIHYSIFFSLSKQSN